MKRQSVLFFLTLVVAAVQGRLLAKLDPKYKPKKPGKAPDALEEAAEESSTSPEKMTLKEHSAMKPSDSHSHPETPSPPKDNSQPMMTLKQQNGMKPANTQQVPGASSNNNNNSQKMKLKNPQHHHPMKSGAQSKDNSNEEQPKKKNTLANHLKAANGPKPKCGSFLIDQSSGFVMYDEYEEIDLVDEDSDMMCQSMVPTEEFCFGKNGQTVALYVQGECHRGVGTTQVSFAVFPTDAPASLLFACRGSDRATPSVKCECSFLDDERDGQECDYTTALPFRAEAHFGNLTMDSGISADCTLICKMPTTDE